MALALVHAYTRSQAQVLNLQVEFDQELLINKVEIYETFHAGGVTNVEALNGSAYVSIYTAQPHDIGSSGSRILAVTAPRGVCCQHSMWCHALMSTLYVDVNGPAEDHSGPKSSCIICGNRCH